VVKNISDPFQCNCNCKYGNEMSLAFSSISYYINVNVEDNYGYAVLDRDALNMCFICVFQSVDGMHLCQCWASCSFSLQKRTCRINGTGFYASDAYQYSNQESQSSGGNSESLVVVARYV